MIVASKKLPIGLGALALATLGLAVGAQADTPRPDQPNPDQHRAHPLVKPALPGAARDGISGNNLGHANAHAGLGGPAAPKPTAIGSVSRKQPH